MLLEGECVPYSVEKGVRRDVVRYQDYYSRVGQLPGMAERFGPL